MIELCCLGNPEFVNTDQYMIEVSKQVKEGKKIETERRDIISDVAVNRECNVAMIFEKECGRGKEKSINLHDNSSRGAPGLSAEVLSQKTH